MFCKVAGIIISAIAAGAYAAPIADCAVLVPNLPPGVGPFCQNCEDGFLNKDGKECAPCETKNCKVCQPPEGEDCTQCKFPYTLIDGECLFLVCGVAEEPDLTFPCSPNCATCPAGNQPFCQECDVGYWNDNGYCKPCCTAGCAVCQPPTGDVCTQCEATNLPAVNGVC